MDTRIYDEQGRLRQFWNDTTRTYTEYDENGVAINGTPRPYTAEENANADAASVVATQMTNRSNIEAQATAALTQLATIRTDLATLANTSKATINADPGLYIKQLGARLDTTALILRRLIRFTFGHFDGTE